MIVEIGNLRTIYTLMLTVFIDTHYINTFYMLDFDEIKSVASVNSNVMVLEGMTVGMTVGVTCKVPCLVCH